MKNIVAIYGDYHHAAAPYARALRKATDGADVQIEALYYPTEFDPGMLSDCDVFVLCKEGLIPGTDERWMDAQGEAAIEQFVAAGGTLFGWHSGLAAYDPDGPVHAMYGGWFRGHPAEHEFELRSTATPSPLYTEKEPFVMSDELYRFELTDEGTHLWLEGHSKEHGVHPVGWTRRHGKGTVQVLTVAHNRSHLMDERMLHVVRRIVTGDAA